MKYYAIYSYLINNIVGTCSDYKDVLFDQCCYKFIKISKEEYKNFDDLNEIKKREILLRPKYVAKQFYRLVLE